MDFEQFVPILIFVAIFAFRFVLNIIQKFFTGEDNTEKKDNKSIVSKYIDKVKNFLKDIIEDYESQINLQKVKQQEISKPPDIPKKQVRRYSYKPSAAEKKVAQQKFYQKRLHDPDENINKLKNREKKILKQHNLKKAIIWSEILSKPVALRN